MRSKPVIGQAYQIGDKAEPRFRGRIGVARSVQAFGITWQVLLDLGGGESVPVIAQEIDLVSGTAAASNGLLTAPSPGAALLAGPPAGLDQWGENPSDLSEAAEGRRFIAAVARLATEFPDLGLPDGFSNRPAGWRMRHNANGGMRGDREGADFERQGVRPGVPDYTLDLARFDPHQKRIFHGWHGELKRATGGDIKAMQRAWLVDLRSRGFWARTHSGYEEMLLDLRLYLALPVVPTYAGELLAATMAAGSPDEAICAALRNVPKLLPSEAH